MGTYSRYHPQEMPYFAGQRPQTRPQGMWEWMKTSSRWKTYASLAENSGWGEQTLQGIAPTHPKDEYTLMVFAEDTEDAQALKSIAARLKTTEDFRSVVKEVLNMQLVQGNMVPALTNTIRSDRNVVNAPIFSTFLVKGENAMPHRWMVFPANASTSKPQTFNRLALINGENQFVHINREVSEVLMPDGVRNFNIVVLKEPLLLVSEAV